MEEARQALSDALADMAETNLLIGDPLPQPDQSVSDREADLEEPLHLLLSATTQIRVEPQLVAV